MCKIQKWVIKEERYHSKHYLCMLLQLQLHIILLFMIHKQTQNFYS